MIRSKLIIASWLLLLVPTLLMGVGAWQLLQNEAGRLAKRNQQSASEQLATVAANLELAIAEVKDGLMQTLVSFSGRDLQQRLARWRQENPLVRNVFIWQPVNGLLFPDPKRPASDEERIFIRRYLPLFSGELKWQQPHADVPTAPQQGPTLAADSVLSERKKLRQLASRAPVASESIVAGKPILSPGERGWHSWYTDNQLHLLGWYRPAGSQKRYGVEIEMMALLSRLLGSITSPYGSNESLALLNGSGEIFYQSGPFEITTASTPVASRTLTPLPHWQLRLYVKAGGQQASSGFLLLGSLLLASFIAAILLGGSLLLWQAFRNQREARQKTSFVANISHELKTPLTTIRMYAELLGEGKIKAADKQRGYLRTIIRESQRLTRLVNNILDFGRLEQGRKTFNPVRTEFKSLVSEILVQQSPRIEDAGLNLEKDFSADDIMLDVDRDAIEQILLNLIDNVIKYAATGGELSIELRINHKQVQLILSDRGPGIPLAEQQKIFEKFHRLDSSLTSAQPGAGLGLSIARQLARGMGGELTCSAGETGGSRFELSLPLAGEKT